MDSNGSPSDAAAAPRRPYWVVGLALLAFVIVVLVGGYLLGTRLRPPVGIEPPPPAPIGASPTVAPTAASATGTAPAPSGSTPAPSELTAGGHVASSPSEQEVEDTYYRYLQIYGDAAINLDTSHLSEVLGGHALQLVTEEIDDRKSRGRPLKVIEDDRQIAFGPITETSAILIDEYTSRSVVLDINTKQPLPRTSPPIRVRQTYVLQRFNGKWQIIDGSREDLGEVSG
jgi:hypothetical protein